MCDSVSYQRRRGKGQRWEGGVSARPKVMGMREKKMAGRKKNVAVLVAWRGRKEESPGRWPGLVLGLAPDQAAMADRSAFRSMASAMPIPA